MGDAKTNHAPLICTPEYTCTHTCTLNSTHTDINAHFILSITYCNLCSNVEVNFAKVLWWSNTVQQVTPGEGGLRRRDAMVLIPPCSSFSHATTPGSPHVNTQPCCHCIASNVMSVLLSPLYQLQPAGTTQYSPPSLHCKSITIASFVFYCKLGIGPLLLLTLMSFILLCH